MGAVLTNSKHSLRSTVSSSRQQGLVRDLTIKASNRLYSICPSSATRSNNRCKEPTNLNSPWPVSCLKTSSLQTSNTTRTCSLNCSKSTSNGSPKTHLKRNGEILELGCFKVVTLSSNIQRSRCQMLSSRLDRKLSCRAPMTHMALLIEVSPNT